MAERGRFGDAVQTTAGFVLHLALLPSVLASGLLVPTVGELAFDWSA